MIRPLLILFVLCSFVTISQNSHSFCTNYGGDGDEIGYSILQAYNTDYIIVGRTGSFGALQTDIHVARMDTISNIRWQKNIGGFMNEVGKGVVELEDSSIVMVGYSNSYGNGGYDAYIVRTDRNGNILWYRTFGGANWDFANSVCRTKDSNIVVCGYTYSFGRGDKDGFILKMDYKGNILWTKTYGGAKGDELNKIIATSDGGYIAAGTTKSYGDSLGDIWITKFDKFGDSLWFKVRGGVKKDVGNSVVQDQLGDYLIAGGSESFSSGKEDAYILKLLNNSTFLWDRYYGIPSQDEEAFDVLNSGSQYGNMLLLYATKEQAAYGFDIKNILLDYGGYYVRGGTFGSEKDEIAYAMCNARDKGYVACGYTESYNAKFKDVFVVKYDSEMTIGPLILSAGKIVTDKKAKIYPTVVNNKTIYIQGTTNVSDLDFKIYDIFGRLVTPVSIEKKEENLLMLKLGENIEGIVIVSMDNGLLIQKCIIN